MSSTSGTAAGTLVCPQADGSEYGKEAGKNRRLKRRGQLDVAICCKHLHCVTRVCGECSVLARTSSGFRTVAWATTASRPLRTAERPATDRGFTSSPNRSAKNTTAAMNV